MLYQNHHIKISFNRQVYQELLIKCDKTAPQRKKMKDFLLQQLFEAGDSYICFDSTDDFIDFASAFFRTEQIVHHFFFNESDFTAIQNIKKKTGISNSDLFNLLALAPDYSTGAAEFPLVSIICDLIANKQRHRHFASLPAEINTLLYEVSQSRHMPMNSIVRSALFYYSQNLGEVPEIRDTAFFKVDSAKIAWQNHVFRCNKSMYNFLKSEKDRTGHSIGVVFNNLLYGFLKHLAGEAEAGNG